MKKFLSNFQQMMNAITFAEAGEWETARRMLPPSGAGVGVRAEVERTFAAVAFAEAGMLDEAERFAGGGAGGSSTRRLLASLGLENVRVRLAIMPVGGMHVAYEVGSD